MQAIFFARVALLAVPLFFCADLALAQRSSTIEEKLEYGWDSARSQELQYTKSATPQQCRDLCLANNQCRYWNWTQPGGKDKSAASIESHSNCVLLKATTGANRGRDFGYPYFGGSVKDGASTAGAPPAASPAPITGELFPWPRAGSELIFRVATAFNASAERYAGFKFIALENNRLRLSRSAWEGPLSAQRQYVDQVQYVTDEAIGRTGDGTCSVTASDQQLRQLAVGAKLNYRRDCSYSFVNGTGSRSSATVDRVVLRSEKVTVPLGTFDALVVKKTTRTTYKSISRSGTETMQEFSESEITRWWVPALGFYVKEESRSRIVDRIFSQQMIDNYRQENEPLPPRTIDWNPGSSLSAVIQR